MRRLFIRYSFNMVPDAIFKLSQYQQVLNVVSELLRAREWQSDLGKFTASLERALNLIDMFLLDPKWRVNLCFLLSLREEIAKVYVRQQTIADVLKVL